MNQFNNRVDFSLWENSLEFDRTMYALYQMSCAFELRVAENSRKIVDNRINGVPYKVSYINGKAANDICPYSWENLEYVKNSITEAGRIASSILRKYNIELSPNWMEINRSWFAQVDRLEKVFGEAIHNATQAALQNQVYKYNQAYNDELSKDFGLGFGILSSSLTAHLLYAAQSAAKERKDHERAEQAATEAMKDSHADITARIYASIYPVYIDSLEPAMQKLLSEYYSYIISLFSKQLGFSYESIQAQFNLEKSNKFLIDSLNAKRNIIEALKNYPNNGNVIGYAIQQDVLDDELCRYGKYATPIFSVLLMRWAISVLKEIYSTSKMFNKPLINDENRGILCGLIRYYTYYAGDITECEDWQNILIEVYGKEIVSTLVDFECITIPTMSPIDFDKAAKEHSKVEISQQSKELFVIFCNDLKASTIVKTANVLELGTTISINSINDCIGIFRKKLNDRNDHFQQVAEEERKKKELLERKKQEEKQEQERKRQIAREQKIKQFKKSISIVLPIIVICIILIIVLNTVIIPSISYNKAINLMDNGKYEEAITAFEALDDFGNSQKKIEDCRLAIMNSKLQEAQKLLDEKKYEEAYTILSSLGEYENSSNEILKSKYDRALQLYNQAEYDSAILLFSQISNYEDSKSWVEKCAYAKNDTVYNEALAKYEAGDYENAKNMFTSINTHRDANDYVTKCSNIISQRIYDTAEKHLKNDDWYKAATTFYSIKDYSDAKQRSLTIWRDNLPNTTITTNNSGLSTHTYAIKTNGSILATGELNEIGYSDLSGIKSWSNISSISANGNFVVGLKNDGTVVATGSNSTNQLSVYSWRNIVQISAGGHGTFGVKSDGSVVSTEYIASSSDWRKFDYGQNDISEWGDIVYISASSFHTVGLKADGTVVAVGQNTVGQCDVNNWKDIVYIETDTVATYGVKADGTVVYTKSGDNISSWRNIKTISVSDYHIVGLKKDGTVVASGGSVADNGELNVGNWNNIVSVVAGEKCTIALNKSGRVYVIGLVGHVDGRGQANGWANIKMP